MWTETTRAQYRRDQLAQASDTTDAEWLLLSFFSARALADRASAPSEPAHGDERDPLYPGDWMPMARAAEGLSAALHRSVLLLSLA